jgi:2-haloalkanoic acid dehalogenase type II
VIKAVLIDFGETLVERVVDDERPLNELVITPFPETRAVLRQLVEAGCRLAVVSNTTMSTETHLREVLRAAGLEAFFDAVLTSHDVGVRKPDPAIYERALALLGCRADEAAMVGNDLDQDISGAAALGMTTVLLARAPDPARESSVVPDFVIASLAELPAVLER